MQSCIVSKPSENIEIVTRLIPEISPDQVLVQVKAAGVNPVDTYIRSGVYFPNQQYPYTPGFDGSGIIAKVGANCKNQNINDRVYIFKATSPYGTYAQYCVAESSCVMPLHPNLTFEQGAALGIPYYSAHRALFFCGNAKPQEKVFIHGASGAVGIAACEIALAAGMEVYGTAGTNAGRTMLLKLGVKEVYNHKESDYIQKIIDANMKFDLIIECLANVNLANDFLISTFQGRIIIVGARGDIEINPRQILAGELTVRGMCLLNAKNSEIESSANEIHRLIDEGKINPVIGTTFELNQANEAHREVIEHSSCTFGKIVICP